MNFELPYLSGVNYESMVYGQGVRAAIYLSGCSHHCTECHNPETHSPTYGQKLTSEMVKQIASEINKRPFLDGITLTGGDPLFDPYRTLAFLKELWEQLDRKVSIWLYTGYTYAEVIKLTQENMAANVIINAYTDVLVDGRFESALADKTLSFRGSSNQRVIDLEKTLQAGHVVQYAPA